MLTFRFLLLLVQLAFPFLGLICRNKLGDDLLRVHGQRPPTSLCVGLTGRVLSYLPRATLR